MQPGASLALLSFVIIFNLRLFIVVIILMPIMQVLNEAVGALMWHTIQLTKEVTLGTLSITFTDNLFGQYLLNASVLTNLIRTWRNSKLCGLLCELAVESTTLMSK